MDGKNPHTSKVINACFRCLLLSGIALNHSMALAVLFHRFTFVVLMILVLMLSKTCLLMILISDLLGLISLQVGLLLKPGLWSFNVINESLCADTSIRSSSSSFSANSLSLVTMSMETLWSVFL